MAAQQYNRPPPQAAMQYQSNYSNQQLNKKHNHGGSFGSKWTFGFWDCFSPMGTWYVMQMSTESA
jgi:hypothetical protein